MHFGSIPVPPPCPALHFLVIEPDDRIADFDELLALIEAEGTVNTAVTDEGEIIDSFLVQLPEYIPKFYTEDELREALKPYLAQQFLQGTLR